MNAKEKILFGFECGRAAMRESAAGETKFARPGSKPSYAPDQTANTLHIKLELNCDFRRKEINGKCTTDFRVIHDGTREIRFDAVGLGVRSVAGPGGKPARYTYKNDVIAVKLPRPARQGETVTIAIRYRISRAVAGTYFIGPDRKRPDKPVQLWTHGETEESRYWFPCYDAPHEKATTEMIATVPRGFFALSNGALLSVAEDRARKTRTFHWRQAIPHSPYLVTLVAGRFSEIKDEWDGIPVLYYCAPGREADARRAFGKTPKMMKFFSEATGLRYPYEKYAQIAVSDFVMGGMEHTTATTQTDRVLMDARAHPEFTADWLVSHELAHQWFGDLLTCREWSHAWLNESFATYFEALFTEHDLGRDEFLYEMRDKLHIYLEEEKEVYRRPIVTHVYRRPDDLFDRHLYEKGSLVLHALRHRLGDVLFWKAIRRYVEKHQGQAVETGDLINAIQESTGKNLRKFFDQWVYGPGHPDYNVHYWWDDSRKSARVRVIQKPVGNHSIFSMPVVLEFITDRGPRRYTETIERKEHEFRYPFAAEPRDFRFDPDHAVPKTIKLSKPHSMWTYQLGSDPNPLGRIDAADQVAQVPTEENFRALARAFLKEKFWGAAVEMALAIGKTDLEPARDFLVRALRSTRHPKARRGVAEALSRFRDPATLAALAGAARKDRSYFVAAEAVRSAAKTRSAKSPSILKYALERDSWNDTIRAAAVSSLHHVPAPETVRILKKYAAYGRSLSARSAAVSGMTRLAKSYPGLFRDLIALAGSDPQGRVRHAAISALGKLGDPRAIPALEKVSKDKRVPLRTRSLAEDSLLKIRPEPDS